MRIASQRSDWAAVERYVALLDRDVQRYEQATTPGAPTTVAALPDTMAEAFTPAATVDWSDDDLLAAWVEMRDDPAAQDQIIATLDWRAQVAEERDAEIAVHEQRKRAEHEERDRAWRQAVEQEDASPLSNPARRPSRRLSVEQVCREEYDSYLHTNYVHAETACRGQLLTREGLTKGIDPESLFSGPAARARKYASEELRAWWARHGRITYSEWKYEWFGRDSDRKAATTARYQSLGEATA